MYLRALAIGVPIARHRGVRDTVGPPPKCRHRTPTAKDGVEQACLKEGGGGLPSTI